MCVGIKTDASKQARLPDSTVGRAQVRHRRYIGLGIACTESRWTDRRGPPTDRVLVHVHPRIERWNATEERADEDF